MASKIISQIIFNSTDVTGTASCNYPAYVRMNEPYAWYGSELIAKQNERFFSNSTGSFIMNLLETDTLTQDTGKEIYYTFTYPSAMFKKKFTIPASTLTANLLDLPTYTGIGC
jgi:hypothetical protein